MDDVNNRVPQYKWAETVKALSNNACAYCGSRKRIAAHHIKPRSAAPSEANNLDNGIALCWECHRIAHNMGYGRASEHDVILSRLNPDTPMGKMNAFIANYAASRIIITIPKAREEAVKAHAKSKGESVNGYINNLIRADMGLSEADWKRTEADEGAEADA